MRQKASKYRTASTARDVLYHYLPFDVNQSVAEQTSFKLKTAQAEGEIKMK